MRMNKTLLVTAALLSFSSGTAFAQSPAPAAPAAAAPAAKTPPPELVAASAACKTALETLCANVEKGGGRRIKCLKENEAKLTPECKSALDKAAAVHAERKAAKATGAAPAAPAAAAPATAPAQK